MQLEVREAQSELAGTPPAFQTTAGTGAPQVTIQGAPFATGEGARASSARPVRRSRRGENDCAPEIEMNVDDIGPEQVARMVKRRMLHLIPTSPTGNDISCLMKVVQVLPGWREGFTLVKQRGDPDADVDLMTLEQASAEVERLMKIAGKAKG
jgi:hypothetical protein